MRFPRFATASKMSSVRWTVAAMLFFATTVNYLDRQIFSLLVPKFEGELRLGPLDLSLINVAFLLSYGFGMLLVGAGFDRVGTKRGLSASFILWKLALVAHGFVHSLGAFVAVRSVLGFGEAGNFPAATKAVAEWFPKKERAIAFGVINSGSNVGLVVASLAIPFLTVRLGLSWQMCFVVLGAIGFVWIFPWLALYHSPERHPAASSAEKAYIASDPPEPVQTMSYPELLGIRSLYGIGLAKALTDAPWWFYITWLPKFLTDQFQLKPAFMAAALPPIFIFADLGAIGGGWLSSHFLQRGMSLDRARKTAMLICACCAIPVIAVGLLNGHDPHSIYVAVVLMSLAAAAHQGWSSNIYTLVSDTLPKSAVGRAVGVITMFGVVGAAAFQFYVGSSAQADSYVGPFLLAGCSYLLALGVLQLVVPRVEPAKPERRLSAPWALAGIAGLLALLAVIQYFANKPPYYSLSEYRLRRPIEKKLDSAVVRDGPPAKVGWMSAQWEFMDLHGAKAQAELIKFDDHGHPYVEPKGVLAPKYIGPDQNEIDRLASRS